MSDERRGEPRSDPLQRAIVAGEQWPIFVIRHKLGVLRDPYPHGPRDPNHHYSGAPCMACGEPLSAGDYTTLVAIGPGGDPDARAGARQHDSFDCLALEVHYACAAGQEPEKAGTFSKATTAGKESGTASEPESKEPIGFGVEHEPEDEAGASGLTMLNPEVVAREVADLVEQLAGQASDTPAREPLALVEMLDDYEFGVLEAPAELARRLEEDKSAGRLTEVTLAMGNGTAWLNSDQVIVVRPAPLEAS